MAIGFGRQSKKDAKGASSASHQLSGQRQKELLPPAMRSPALESRSDARDSNGAQRFQKQGPRDAAGIGFAGALAVLGRAVGRQIEA